MAGTAQLLTQSMAGMVVKGAAGAAGGPLLYTYRLYISSCMAVVCELCGFLSLILSFYLLFSNLYFILSFFCFLSLTRAAAC
jgi:hypothetical protein